MTPEEQSRHMVGHLAELERELEREKRRAEENGTLAHDLGIQLASFREERDRLAQVIDAATVLIAAKGRHNTMLAYEGLRGALAAVKDSENENNPATGSTTHE